MILSLGDFKFTIQTNIDSFNRNIDAGINFSDRISNHAAAVVAKRCQEIIRLKGDTLPGAGSGQEALKDILKMVEEQKPQILSNQSECLGTFMIVSFDEGRASFGRNGEFLKQDFSLELRRVGDDENIYG